MRCKSINYISIKNQNFFWSYFYNIRNEILSFFRPIEMSGILHFVFSQRCDLIFFSFSDFFCSNTYKYSLIVEIFILINFTNAVFYRKCFLIEFTFAFTSTFCCNFYNAIFSFFTISFKNFLAFYIFVASSFYHFYRNN